MDVIDSWEAGRQDWTDDFAAKFKARCGYDCIPYLPALTGRNVLRVGSAQSVMPVGAAFHRRPDADAVSITTLQMTKEEAQWATKFLIDYEATKKHLFETEFLAPFAERAHKLGLLVAGEPYGDGDFDMETFVKYLDLLKAAGVRRFVFHSIVHQPSNDSALTMVPFGTRFDRAHCTPSALRRITDYIKQR